jgi:cytidylate kinase
MPVIALTQEMGSLAPEVAQLVAQEGKLALMRHEVLEGVAGKLHVPTSLISRLREGKAGRRERRSVDLNEVAVYSASEVFALADKGDVVLRGWGATCLLHPVQHVVTVRITRPFEKRVAWLMENLGTDDLAAAQSEVRRSDEAHATRMHAAFGVTWGDPLLYDMVLNTDRISVESCAAQILQLASRPEFQETKSSRAQVADLALAAAVRGALKETESTREVNVDIQAEKGKIVLRGIVLNEQEREEAVRVAGAVPGVKKVDSRLGQMAVYRRFTHAKT